MKMTIEGKITKWFCDHNNIERDRLDKYHRYAIATAVKYEEYRVKNLPIPVVSNNEVSVCDCTHTQACRICGEEKGLDGDFWKNIKQTDC